MRLLATSNEAIAKRKHRYPNSETSPSWSWVSEQSRASTFRRVTQLCSPRRRGFDMPASRHSGPHLAKAITEVSAEPKTGTIAKATTRQLLLRGAGNPSCILPNCWQTLHFRPVLQPTSQTFNGSEQWTCPIFASDRSLSPDEVLQPPLWHRRTCRRKLQPAP